MRELVINCQDCLMFVWSWGDVVDFEFPAVVLGEKKYLHKEISVSVDPLRLQFPRLQGSNFQGSKLHGATHPWLHSSHGSMGFLRTWAMNLRGLLSLSFGVLVFRFFVDIVVDYLLLIVWCYIMFFISFCFVTSWNHKIVPSFPPRNFSIIKNCNLKIVC